MDNPTPQQVKQARKVAGLNQLAAANLIYYSRHATWSDFETGKTPMGIGDWELFLIKTGQHPDYKKSSC